jgi:drug/metabolite transporter (DMT)-like permease
MAIFLAILRSLALPLGDVLRRHLSERQYSSLTIIFSINIVGHLVGIAYLLYTDRFSLPDAPFFYIFWAVMVGIAAGALTVNIWALRKTTLFNVQSLAKLTFISGALAGVLVVGESLVLQEWVALGIALLGTMAFVYADIWENAASRTPFAEKGILLMLVSVALGGIGAAFYKLATTHVGDYWTLLTGRFVADYMIWGSIWFIGVLVIHCRNPVTEMRQLLTTKAGLVLALLFPIEPLLHSWLIYELPLTTLMIIGTISIPVSYVWSFYKHKKISMWSTGGSLLIVLSVLCFVTAG